MAQTGTVLSFLRARRPSNDWSQQELAEFYRVQSALLQHGLEVTTDRGLSDEGDPWFAFCRSDTEEVIAHFARTAGHYLVVSSAFSGVAKGRDFKMLVRELIEAHPLMLPRNHGEGQKIFVHPAASLAALLAASYLVSSHKDAVVQDVSAASHENATAFWLQFRHDFAILSTVAIAATLIGEVGPFFDAGQDITMLQDTGHDLNLPAHITPHVIDAALHDAGAPALHGGGTVLQGIADEAQRASALETQSDPDKVTFSPPNAVLKAASISDMKLAVKVDIVADPAGGTKTNDGGSFNDADHSAQTWLDFDTAIAARPLLGSAAIGPTTNHLGSTSTISAGAVAGATNEPVALTHENATAPENIGAPVVASALPQPLDGMQALGTGASTSASPQDPSPVAPQQSTTPAVQTSPDVAVQAVAGTTTPDASAGVQATSVPAHVVHQASMAHLTADSHIVGITSHADAVHIHIHL